MLVRVTPLGFAATELGITMTLSATDDPQGRGILGLRMSEAERRVFGDAGRHARSAIGVHALPSNMSIELELTVEVGDEPAA